MQLPKPSPLQPRLLALVITTCLVAVLSTCQPDIFAYAADVAVPPEVVHTEFEASIPPTPPDEPPIEIRDGLEDEGDDALYAPLFAYFDRSLVGRQQDDLADLNNSQMKSVEIAPNNTRTFRFKKSQLGKRSVLEEVSIAPGRDESLNDSSETDGDAQGALVKRQAQSRLWISANTCRQPVPTTPIVSDNVAQLTLWVWTSTSSAPAVPTSSNKPVGNSTFSHGYVNYTLATDQDVYIAVTAPALTEGWTGSWSFDIAASTDGSYYHNYDNSTNFIYMVDTDSDSTLFITHNMTDFNDTAKVDAWIDTHKGANMPFNIYAFPNGPWSPMMGLERSYCGLKTQFDSSNNLSVATSITTQFGQGLPKGMFNVEGLTNSMNYTGFLVLNGTSNMTIDGTVTNPGGRVFKSFQWQTKAGTSSPPLPPVLPLNS